eukprot:TRINITY_DN668_c2_g1_i1.p1 TRINITY_DN668_c2_g1~~TRINITY_DN668_c2_g1_i1.p1  ORF type:complete len:1584 (-),score=248.04 TRINITY_DN668_c2_g1_i1:194-4945(-)
MAGKFMQQTSSARDASSPKVVQLGPVFQGIVAHEGKSFFSSRSKKRGWKSFDDRSATAKTVVSAAVDTTPDQQSSKEKDIRQQAPIGPSGPIDKPSNDLIFGVSGIPTSLKPPALTATAAAARPTAAAAGGAAAKAATAAKVEEESDTESENDTDAEAEADAESSWADCSENLRPVAASKPSVQQERRPWSAASSPLQGSPLRPSPSPCQSLASSSRSVSLTPSTLLDFSPSRQATRSTSFSEPSVVDQTPSPLLSAPASASVHALRTAVPKPALSPSKQRPVNASAAASAESSPPDVEISEQGLSDVQERQEEMEMISHFQDLPLVFQDFPTSKLNLQVVPSPLKIPSASAENGQPLPLSSQASPVSRKGVEPLRSPLRGLSASRLEVQVLTSPSENLSIPRQNSIFLQLPSEALHVSTPELQALPSPSQMLSLSKQKLRAMRSPPQSSSASKQQNGDSSDMSSDLSSSDSETATSGRILRKRALRKKRAAPAVPPPSQKPIVPANVSAPPLKADVKSQVIAGSNTEITKENHQSPVEAPTVSSEQMVKDSAGAIIRSDDEVAPPTVLSTLLPAVPSIVPSTVPTTAAVLSVATPLPLTEAALPTVAPDSTDAPPSVGLSRISTPSAEALDVRSTLLLTTDVVVQQVTVKPVEHKRFTSSVSSKASAQQAAEQHLPKHNSAKVVAEVARVTETNVESRHTSIADKGTTDGRQVSLVAMMWEEGVVFTLWTIVFTAIVAIILVFGAGVGFFGIEFLQLRLHIVCCLTTWLGSGVVLSVVVACALWYLHRKLERQVARLVDRAVMQKMASVLLPDVIRTIDTPSLHNPSCQCLLGPQPGDPPPMHLDVDSEPPPAADHAPSIHLPLHQMGDDVTPRKVSPELPPIDRRKGLSRDGKGSIGSSGGVARNRWQAATRATLSGQSSAPQSGSASSLSRQGIDVDTASAETSSRHAGQFSSNRTSMKLNSSPPATINTSSLAASLASGLSSRKSRAGGTQTPPEAEEGQVDDDKRPVESKAKVPLAASNRWLAARQSIKAMQKKGAGEEGVSGTTSAKPVSDMWTAALSAVLGDQKKAATAALGEGADSAESTEPGDGMNSIGELDEEVDWSTFWDDDENSQEVPTGRMSRSSSRRLSYDDINASLGRGLVPAHSRRTSFEEGLFPEAPPRVQSPLGRSNRSRSGRNLIGDQNERERSRHSRSSSRTRLAEGLRDLASSMDVGGSGRSLAGSFRMGGDEDILPSTYSRSNSRRIGSEDDIGSQTSSGHNSLSRDLNTALLNNDWFQLVDSMAGDSSNKASSSHINGEGYLRVGVNSNGKKKDANGRKLGQSSSSEARDLSSPLSSEKGLFSRSLSSSSLGRQNATGNPSLSSPPDARSGTWDAKAAAFTWSLQEKNNGAEPQLVNVDEGSLAKPTEGFSNNLDKEPIISFPRDASAGRSASPLKQQYSLDHYMDLEASPNTTPGAEDSARKRTGKTGFGPSGISSIEGDSARGRESPLLREAGNKLSQSSQSGQPSQSNLRSQMSLPSRSRSPLTRAEGGREPRTAGEGRSPALGRMASHVDPDEAPTSWQEQSISSRRLPRGKSLRM